MCCDNLIEDELQADGTSDHVMMTSLEAGSYGGCGGMNVFVKNIYSFVFDKVPAKNYLALFRLLPYQSEGLIFFGK